MCGIAGFIERSAAKYGDEWQASAAAVLERMCRVITHRGPDDQGAMVADGVALGMRRLSIIDLAGGHQPISGENGTITTVFNGEIYNYRELQRELEERGHRFATQSDTETIVHAYEEYGPACVNRFRGMFAIAIWDQSNRTLFIARDRVGKKPLYYTLTQQGTFVFGSELKAVLQHPQVVAETDPEAVDAYLTFGYVPDPMCILRGVQKLLPGHYLTFANGRVSIERYWDFCFKKSELKTEQEYIESLRALLNDAVRIRMVADVPLGAFLSGGVDSSTVVGLMSQNSTTPIKTFSIGFKEDTYNELNYARVAAKHFGTDHHEFIVTPDSCQIVDDLVWHFDEPFADPSAIPTYIVSKLARQYVTVALSGDGGDELFAGYTRYAIDKQRHAFARLPRFIRQGVMEPFSRRLPHGAWGRNYIHNVALEPIDRYIDGMSFFTNLNKVSLYTNSFIAQLKNEASADSLFHKHVEHSRSSDHLEQLLYLDSKTYLPGVILTKVDRMSMAVSLEARAPLLDHVLIDFVTSIPPEMKMKGLVTKHIFKEAVRDFVPVEILDRAKQGFGLPIEKWINNQLRDRIRETLLEKRTRERGYTNADYVKTLLDEHERGRRDQSMPLWVLFMFELWHRRFIDGKSDNGAEQRETEGVLQAG